jgi:hypothetical protein
MWDNYQMIYGIQTQRHGVEGLGRGYINPKFHD